MENKKDTNTENEAMNTQQVNSESEKNTITDINDNNKENSSQENNEVLTKKIEELNQQLSELNDKYIRLLAEFDNFRKRTRKEKDALIEYAGENAWKSILPVLDDFERAIKENQSINDTDIIKKGFELIYNKLKHIITQNQITAIDSLHKDFNSDIMEAVAKVPAPSEEMKGKVIEELEKAYQLKDKIIRYAKVVVAE